MVDHRHQLQVAIANALDEFSQHCDSELDYFLVVLEVLDDVATSIDEAMEEAGITPDAGYHDDFDEDEEDDEYEAGWKPDSLWDAWKDAAEDDLEDFSASFDDSDDDFEDY